MVIDFSQRLVTLPSFSQHTGVIEINNPFVDPVDLQSVNDARSGYAHGGHVAMRDIINRHVHFPSTILFEQIRKKSVDRSASPNVQLSITFNHIFFGAAR
jgi:hypothetical protein